MDGCPVGSEGERQRVIPCLEAAIRRRTLRYNTEILITLETTHQFSTSYIWHITLQGIRLELCGEDTVGLLSDVTRIFRENGLSVTRAEVTTRGSKAMNAFYVTDASGNQVKSETTEAVRNEIGLTVLYVKQDDYSQSPSKESARFCLENLFRSSLRSFFTTWVSSNLVLDLPKEDASYLVCVWHTKKTNF